MTSRSSVEPSERALQRVRARGPGSLEPALEGAHVRPDIGLGKRLREEENAGKAETLARRLFDQWSEVLVVPGHDDPILATRPIEDRRILRPREADVSNVNHVDAAALKLLHGRYVDVLIEQKPEPSLAGRTAQPCGPLGSRRAAIRAFSSRRSSISSGKDSK